MKATIVKKLFAGRRWMLWLPVPLLCWSAWPDWQHIPARLLAGLVFGFRFGSPGGSVMATPACPGGRVRGRVGLR